MNIACKVVLLAVGVAMSCSVSGQESGGAPVAVAVELPSPLTLENALKIADQVHPVSSPSSAEIELARAEVLQVYADDDVTLRLQLEGRWIDPSTNSRLGSNNDSRARLVARKRLYDFGRTRALQSAADAHLASRESQHVDDRRRYRVEVMHHYFEVLLADLRFARDDEAMAIAFVRSKEAADRTALGELSDIDALALEDVYQARRVARFKSEAQQRATRSRLAQLLNSPDNLPSLLLEPALPENDQPLPEYQELLDLAFSSNALLQGMDAEIQSGRERLRAHQAIARPVLFGTLQASEHQRETNSSHPLVAELSLDVPLYLAGRPKAAEAKGRARLQMLAAEKTAIERQLRQELLETWQLIQVLRVQREQAEVFTDYRELSLDRSRAQYELDVETNFGNALVEQSEARLFHARTEFELALAWARLAALSGQPYSPVVEVAK